MKKSENAEIIPQVTSKVDLSLNKDDLIEILIETKLSELEKDTASLKKELEELNEKFNIEYSNIVKDKMVELLEKRCNKKIVEMIKFYMKNFDIGAKKGPIITSKYTYDVYDLIKISINEPPIQIKTNEDIRIDHSDYTDNMRSIKNKTELICDQIHILLKETDNIKASGKRIKARMLKEMLSKSSEGTQVLKLIQTKEINVI